MNQRIRLFFHQLSSDWSAELAQYLKPEDVRHRFALHHHSKAGCLPSAHIQVLHYGLKGWRRCGNSPQQTVQTVSEIVSVCVCVCVSDGSAYLPAISTVKVQLSFPCLLEATNIISPVSTVPTLKSFSVCWSSSGIDISHTPVFGASRFPLLRSRAKPLC